MHEGRAGQEANGALLQSTYRMMVTFNIIVCKQKQRPRGGDPLTVASAPLKSHACTTGRCLREVLLSRLCTTTKTMEGKRMGRWSFQCTQWAPPQRRREFW